MDEMTVLGFKVPRPALADDVWRLDGYKTLTFDVSALQPVIQELCINKQLYLFYNFT